MPKMSYNAKRIRWVYVILVALCLLSLKFAGMDWFDALCHSLTTISTGGFSTKNASIGAFNNPAIEWIISLFMFLGAIPLTFYPSLLVTKSFHSVRSTHVLTFAKVLFASILFTALWLFFTDVYDFFTALRPRHFSDSFWVISFVPFLIKFTHNVKGNRHFQIMSKTDKTTKL